MHSGSTAEFSCMTPTGAGRIEWLINGAPYHDNFPHVVILPGRSKLQFKDTVLQYNRTSVQCATSYRGISYLSSNGTLIVHGIILLLFYL